MRYEKRPLDTLSLEILLVVTENWEKSLSSLVGEKLWHEIICPL